VTGDGAFGRLDGDTVVALLGICMALMILSRGSAVRRLPMERRIGYAAIWAILIGGLAYLANHYLT